MQFKLKYSIDKQYLTKGTKRRSGNKINNVKFIVAHDTGNKNSTAQNNVTYYQRSNNEMSASAHIFVDDKNIIECIPALTDTPEKAWHVLYNVTTDNKMFGADANDVAIGVEYCYGSNIDSNEAYKRYVWTLAYICYKFNLDPAKAIVGHHILDPNRKTDPVSGLRDSGRTYAQLLKDVVAEYKDCTSDYTKVTVVVNGKQLPVQGFLINNRTHVPLRAIGEAIGAKIDWNPTTQDASINGQVVDGFVISGTTYVPLHVLGNTIGATVTWNQKTYTATFNT
jgi:N-acetylmuramoyl-L-alanine amidase